MPGLPAVVLDFISDEVLSDLAVTTVDFLLRTSLLERLTGGLGDAVTGRDDRRRAAGPGPSRGASGSYQVSPTALRSRETARGVLPWRPRAGDLSDSTT